MSSDIDWKHELDRSFGNGEDLPAGHFVASGRGALRRRRRAVALVLAASITVAGTAAWATSPAPATRGDAPVATQPAAVEQEGAGQDAKEREKRLRSLAELSAAADAALDFSGPATLTDHGLVLAQQSGPVLQREPNPMGYTSAQGESLAIRVIYRGREHYLLMSLFGDGSSSSIYNAATGDFAGWLAHAVQTQRTLDDANGVTPSSGDTSHQSWLTLTPDGEITSSRPGIVLAEVRTDVDLGPDFAGTDDRTGAVLLLIDGRQEFAVYRVIDSALEVIPGGGSFDSLSAFVTWARGEYASGEGLR